MGTRHLTIIKMKGKSHAQYGQWDGYPEGAGVKVLAFLQQLLKSDEKKDTFLENFSKAKNLSPKEIQKRWATISRTAAKSGLVTFEDAGKFEKKWPQLSRNMGSGVLDYILTTPKPELLPSDDSFMLDSLFCEWAWVVDFKKSELQCFEGFNKKPLGKGQPLAGKNSLCVRNAKKLSKKFGKEFDESNIYYPVRLTQTIPFDQVTKLTTKKFLGLFKGKR